MEEMTVASHVKFDCSIFHDNICELFMWGANTLVDLAEEAAQEARRNDMWRIVCA